MIKKISLMFGALVLSVVSQAYQFNSIGSNTDANRHRQLLWVYNADGDPLANGDVIEWADGTVVDGLEVQHDTGGDSTLVAGVAIKAIASGAWGFIQTHGYHPAIKVNTATVPGDLLDTSTTEGQSKVDNTFGMDSFAVALETTTSSTTVKGFIYK